MSSWAITVGVWMADATRNAMRVMSHACLHDRPNVTTASVVHGVVATGVGAALDAKLRAAGVDQAQQVAGAGIVYVAASGASALVGATLLVRRPAHPVGWLFTAFAVTIVTWGLSESFGVYGLFVRPGSLPGATAAAVVANSIFVVAFVLVALVCSRTPDGRYLSSRWQTASTVMVIAACTWVGLRPVSPEPLEEPTSSNPGGGRARSCWP